MNPSPRGQSEIIESTHRGYAGRREGFCGEALAKAPLGITATDIGAGFFNAAKISTAKRLWECLIMLKEAMASLVYWS